MKSLINKIKGYGLEQVLFIFATIFSSGIHFLFSIYIKAYVLPLEYGMYSTCLLLQSYMSYLQLGTLNAFNRDYPQLVGSGEKEKCELYRNVVFSFILIVYFVSSIIMAGIIITISRTSNMDMKYTIGLILMVIITTITMIENYGNYRCRIDKGFKYISIVTFLELLSIPLSLFLIKKIGYYAIFINSILAMVIGIAFYYKYSYRDFKYVIDRKLLSTIIKSGMPLLISGLIWTVVNSIDKFVILGFINTEALGIYGIAQNAFTYMILIPTAMSQIFYAQMGMEYGKNQNIKVLTDVSMKFSTVLAAITSIISLIAYFFLPILVDNFMPSYKNGVQSSQILILGLSIYAATLIDGNILTILKKNKALLINSACMCVFNIICSIGYVMIIGARIESVALGTATSYIFCTFIIVYQVHKYANCKVWTVIKASIMPVCISLFPGVIIYNSVSSRVLGFMLAITCVVIFYWIFYRKQILSIGKEK